MTVVGTAQPDTFIRVSAEVFDWLRDLAEPGDSADTVLRRVAGIPARVQGRKSYVLKPKPEGAAA